MVLVGARLAQRLDEASGHAAQFARDALLLETEGGGDIVDRRDLRDDTELVHEAEDDAVVDASVRLRDLNHQANITHGGLVVGGDRRLVVGESLLQRLRTCYDQSVYH